MEDEGWSCVVKCKKKKNKLEQKDKKEKEDPKIQIEYLLRNYHIRICKKSLRDHNKSVCINAHNDKEVRRYPFQSESNENLLYSKHMCADKNNDGYCNLGDKCMKSHNEAEQHFHPAIFKTQLCERRPCRQAFCYFAHGNEELRNVAKKYDDVTKERSISFSEFIQIPESVTVEKEVIEIIRDWTGWQNKVGTSELLPCPIQNVFSRMIFKYPELQLKVRELCLKEGCTPYMEINQISSQYPVSLLIKGSTRDAICTSTMNIKAYLEKCRNKTEERFPPRFLRYTQGDIEGVKLLKSICFKNKGIDISVDTRANKLSVWGNSLKQRQNIVYELKKICTNFALTDAQAIADAKLRSLQLELQQTQQQLQLALQEKYEVLNNLKSAENLVNKIYEEQHQKQTTVAEVSTKLKIPSTWQSTEDYQEFKLDNDTEEWDQIHTSFLATIGHAYRFQVVCITRIENHELWEHYTLMKKKIGNEKQLWHGTEISSIFKICQNGYNRSYAGMHATAYGEGTYFARDSTYSVNYASRDKTTDVGYRFMILTKVLVGRYEQGERGKKTLGESYDSAVNNVKDPSIYVIFRDYQAYPAYIVKFK